MRARLPFILMNSMNWVANCHCQHALSRRLMRYSTWQSFLPTPRHTERKNPTGWPFPACIRAWRQACVTSMLWLHRARQLVTVPRMKLLNSSEPILILFIIPCVKTDPPFSPTGACAIYAARSTVLVFTSPVSIFVRARTPMKPVWPNCLKQ